MSAEQRLFFWLVVAAVLIVCGIGAALKLFYDTFVAPSRNARREVKPVSSLELLRIELNPSTQQLQLYLAGRPARTQDIADEPLRVQVQSLMRLLQPESAGTPTPPPAIVEPPALPAAPDDEPRESFLTRLRDSLSPRTYSAPPLAVSPTSSRAAATVASTANMFEQINKILQRRAREQAYTTPLEIIGEGGELHIKYGEQIYLQVDAVPDERARTLIRAAVGEWEAS